MKIEIESGDSAHLLEALELAGSIAAWSKRARHATDAERQLATLRLDAYRRLAVAVEYATPSSTAPGEQG